MCHVKRYRKETKLKAQRGKRFRFRKFPKFMLRMLITELLHSAQPKANNKLVISQEALGIVFICKLEYFKRIEPLDNEMYLNQANCEYLNI